MSAPWPPCPASWSLMTPCLHPDGDGHEGRCVNGDDTWERNTSWFCEVLSPQERRALREQKAVTR